jgi:aminopeptidase N
MKNRYGLPQYFFILLITSLVFTPLLKSELYEPIKKSNLPKPSLEEFEKMAEEREEMLPQLKNGEMLLEREKFYQFQSWTEPTPNMLDYDVTHYEINIGLDFADQFISGYGKTVLRSLKDNLTFIELNLGYALEVSQVILDDSINISYSRPNWYLLTCYLPEALDSGDEISLKVYYSGYPNSVGFMRFYQYGSSNVCYTSVEPYGSRFWWPCKDFPFDKPDSVDVIVTHPSAYTLVSNGLMRSRVDNGDGTATTHWHEGYPIATYLVMVGCTNYLEFDQSWEYAPGQFMPIRQFYYPDAPPTETWTSAYYFQNYTIPSLESHSYWFTLYPFVEERYGHNHYGWGGAMEHQTNTSILPDFNSDWVIAHECAHQWGGDLVTCRNFHHIWLNEGFASYAEVLYYRYFYGEQYARLWLKSQKHTGAGTPYVENLETDDVFDGTTVYDKASWVFYMLNMILGDDDFRTAMDMYFHDPDLMYKSALTSDLQRVCEEVYGAPMGWFFNTWVYQPGNPEYSYSYEALPNKADGYSLYLAIDQVQEWVQFTMPIEVRAYLGAADTTFKVFNDLPQQLFRFDLPEMPDSVVIDPDEKILCEKVHNPDFGVHIWGKNLPEGNVGSDYYVDFEAVGGTQPYTWSLAGGQIPYGLQFHGGSEPYIYGIPNYAATFNFRLKVEDSSDPVQSSTLPFRININSPLPICGDFNSDQVVDINDAVFLVNYIYLGGDEPDVPELADVNCDGRINLVDIIYIINYIFRGGPEPCADCPQ